MIIVLEDIRSALNVGAIFRTCDAVGAEKLILTGITPCPPHPKIPKTALGAIDSVKWEYLEDTSELFAKYGKDYEIIAVELAPKSVELYKCKFPKKTILVFGNEISGVSEYTLNKANRIVKIPMLGIKESLNIATSVGITAYEVFRQLNYTP